MFQTIAQDLFQGRFAAVDPATGEVLWDTQFSDRLTWDAAVLTSGRRYTYLTTDAGLAVVSLADGEAVGEGAGVDGLGERFLTSRAAYAYDPAAHRVMALTMSGEVLAIPLDQATATPVDAPTSATWARRLSIEQRPGSPARTTADEALLAGGERVALRDLPFDGLGRELVRVPANGGLVPVGGTAFHDARLVVVGGVAAGGAGGRVLVVHQRSVNDTGRALSLVSLVNGQILGTLGITYDVGQAVTARDGTTVVTTSDVLAVARPNGTITRVDVGATDFFGSPS
jgi:hypothetical protein